MIYSQTIISIVPGDFSYTEYFTLTGGPEQMLRSLLLNCKANVQYIHRCSTKQLGWLTKKQISFDTFNSIVILRR